jgi:hypothetical protein
MKCQDRILEISKRPSGFAGLGAVLLGGQLFMKLAAGTAGSASGEHVWNAHHSKAYAKARRLTPMPDELRGPFFNPETRFILFQFDPMNCAQLTQEFSLYCV